MLLNRWLVIMIFGLALDLLVPGTKIAHGYLLPAEQIIEFVTEQTARVYNFRLEAVAETPDPEYPEITIKRAMVYYAARPDYLRQEMVGEAESGTVLVGTGQRLSVIDGHLVAERPRHEDIFPLLLLSNSPETLRVLLAAEQVDLSQVHLSRLGGRIAYVIGGPPGDPEAPQFWCDKDNFWPLRLVGLRSYHGVTNLIDIRFLAYQQVTESIWLPMEIEFYRQNQLVLKLVVEKVGFNERLPDSLFDLEKFAAKFPPLPPPKEPTEKPTEALEEMRRYLKKKYE
jgi:outer membrane lipoprotein-sorting protein